MPIEFNCPQCAKRLAVPDESAGSKAQCPQCQIVLSVPSASEAVPFGQAAAGGANPYSAPPVGVPPTKKPSYYKEITPTAVQPGEVIEYAWDVWKRNLGILVGVTVVVIMISMAVSGIQQAATFALIPDFGIEVAQLVGIAIGFFGNAIQLFLSIGQIQINLKLLRGQRADFAELFGGGSLFLRALGATIVAGFALLFGFIALIIPGFLLLLFFWPYFHLIVDRKSKAMESFSMAYSFASQNVGTTIVIWLASIGISILGFLALCVGILFAAPLVSMMFAAAYLMMSGQVTTRPRQF